MLTTRTIASLSQFLALQSRSNVEVLLIKHDVPKPIGEWGDRYLEDGDIFDALSNAPPTGVVAVLTEVWRTINNLKRGVGRDRLEERLNDLYMCMTLDGYVLNGDKLVKMEPEFEGGGAPEDDLTSELKDSNLEDASEVIELLNRSAEDFRKSPADLNGALSNARVALQTLATSISRTHAETRSDGFDESKWGQVIDHLKKAGVLAGEEEKGLTGVFTFASPGAHKHVGLSDVEMVRLGRSLVVSMCYFLIKRYNG